MIRETDPSIADDSQVEALLAFDDALAAGADPSTSDWPASPLDAVHECQRLLEAVWPRSVPTSSDLPGRFGRFSIVREVGRGGFGVVFLAVDPGLRRQVALKVPRPEVMAAASIRRRFLREAEAASRLDHPHIVPVYEVGEEGPICYIASAYCEGPTLAEWRRGRMTPVPWSEAARLVAVLAAAVAHAHRRGILHRDLKPGNILLQPCEGAAPESKAKYENLASYVPRICDFGLAKLLDEVSQETCSGLAIGSPPYMAPEQAAGRTREQGPATDVYALGVILYELLTGRPPLRGETDLETLRLVADLDPPPPRALRPGLPRDLETICLKCLEKRPERRYAGASELAEDIERFLEGRPIRARRASAWERAWKWARRRPVHAALVAVVATILLGGLGGFEWARCRERQYNEVLTRSLRSEAKGRDRILRHESASKTRQAGVLVERGETDLARLFLDAVAPSPGEPGSHEFAWRYLDRTCVPRLTMVPALPRLVTGVASSPDGRTIALSDLSQQLYLMDRVSGRLRSLPGRHQFDCRVIPFFSPDGRTLVSLCGHSSPAQRNKIETMLWDVATGEEIAGLPRVLDLVYTIVFSRDGRELVTVEATGINRTSPVRSWAISEDRRRVNLKDSLRADQLSDSLDPARRLKRPSARPFQFSDALAVTSGVDPWTAVWSEGRVVRFFRTRSGYMDAVGVDNGTEVVVLPRNDKPAPYSPAVLDLIRQHARVLTRCDRVRLIGHDMPVLWASFSRDGRTAAVTSPYPNRPHDGRVRLLDVATGEILAESPMGDVTMFCSLQFGVDGDEVLVGGIDERLRRWSIRDWRGPDPLAGHKKEVWDLAFSPDGGTLVSAADDHTLKLWDVASGEERATLIGHESLVTAVAYSPDGALLASAGFDCYVRLWDAATRRLLATLGGHPERVRAVAFSPDGKWLASGGNDFQVRLWGIAAGRERPSPLSGHTGSVGSVAFSPDGKTLYSGSGDKTIRLWDVATGEAVEVWPAQDTILRLVLSPDGRTLATAHEHGKVTLWDVAAGRAKDTLPGHTAEVFGLAFSPDGRTLASVGADKTVRLWDPVTAQEILVLKGHAARIRAAAFSPDGTILATGSEDGAIKLWRASTPTK